MNKHHKVNISCTRALTEMPSSIVMTKIQRCIHDDDHGGHAIACERANKIIKNRKKKKTRVSAEKNKIKRKQNEFRKIKRKERKTCFAFLLL